MYGRDWTILEHLNGEYETPQIREKRYQALLKEIANLNPDIIAINEANFLPDYIKRLANDLNYDFIFTMLELPD
jgi:mRNA deadenylase 3'-5' endonuclease subunit Ccr4